MSKVAITPWGLGEQQLSVIPPDAGRAICVS